MKKGIEEAYKHCFGHLCANGAITLLTQKEAVNIYTDTMCKDLKDCGVIADKEKVADYIASQYQKLKEIREKDTNIIRM